MQAFEFMPRSFIEGHRAAFPGAREPFDAPREVNILLEVASTAPRDARPGPDGAVPLLAAVEEVLADAI